MLFIFLLSHCKMRVRFVLKLHNIKQLARIAFLNDAEKVAVKIDDVLECIYLITNGENI